MKQKQRRLAELQAYGQVIQSAGETGNESDEDDYEEESQSN